MPACAFSMQYVWQRKELEQLVENKASKNVKLMNSGQIALSAGCYLLCYWHHRVQFFECGSKVHELMSITAKHARNGLRNSVSVIEKVFFLRTLSPCPCLLICYIYKIFVTLLHLCNSTLGLIDIDTSSSVSDRKQANVGNPSRYHSHASEFDDRSIDPIRWSSKLQHGSNKPMSFNIIIGKADFSNRFV